MVIPKVSRILSANCPLKPLRLFLLSAAAGKFFNISFRVKILVPLYSENEIDLFYKSINIKFMDRLRSIGPS
ncbi:MAG: hypothetical protein A3F83_14705 [Candidatus Glassbacteria bacterium RIFCSPLOWO2_12_FULL_58_11]|uniref:Uncharacterized protein n=1 Tax=Candidatus Glassbacteria bacterium RIFCSPLOWO2_12_FULL_58_11 TaxID=1817867 RepID=A0A1F5YRB6_9BACT|nr:MAG: hypothetical protein A3F83_14705 [Candidatus Glassbacteria bacterium RIFCSPLOWO2_12_FULL_58_11]